MPVFTPEQLAQIQALMAKNSSSRDSSDDKGSDLVSALAAPSATPAASDNSTPVPTKTVTPGASADWSPGQPPVDASNPTPDVSGGIPQPNGGMNPQQLAAETALNPGPIATTGFNPNNPGPVDAFKDLSKGPAPASNDSDSDEDEATPAAKAGGAVSKPSSVSDLLSKMQQSQPTQAPVTADPNAGMNALVQAQKQAQAGQMLANLGRAGETIASGFSRGAYKPDNAFYEDLGKQAQQPVANQLQKQAFAGTQNAQALQAMQVADEKEKNDPNSSVSQLARQVMASTGKQAGINLGDISKLNASQIEKSPVWKAIETTEQIKSRQAIAEQNNLYRQSLMGNKLGQQQLKNFNQTGQQLEQMRGSPAVAQAEKDLYASQKANSLANLYGDPNKLSQSQVNLMAQEIGKIAAGGVSSQAELDGITPHTLTGKMSQYTTNLTNNPTPANAAAFVKQYQDYAGALANDAQKTITDRYGRILNPAKKAELTDEQNKALEDQYLNRFKQQTRAPQAATQPLTSQDQQAIDWAKNNLGDNRAQAILKLHGMK